jgi:diguanylate cyclase (GGDEF)-like protein
MPHERTNSSLINASHRWALAGTIGLVTTAVLLARHATPFDSQPLAVLFAVIAGWSVMLLCAPWKHVHQLHRLYQEILHLRRLIENAARSDQPCAGESFVLNRDDEVGDLSVALGNLITRLNASRRQARTLKQSMDENVRKETARATRKLQKQAATDPLTGLGNRRALERALDELVVSNRRRHQRVVAMAIDLDKFKPINDTLGHAVGDQCLQFLGDLLRSALRSEDRAARIGGDEFIALLPDQSMQQAKAVAERMGKLFGQMPWSFGDVGRPTLSIGLASVVPNDVDDPNELLRRADEALYASKRRGRNCITAWQEIRHAA